MRTAAERPQEVYLDRELAVLAVKVLPGAYFVTDRKLSVVTVLGSCVAVCLHDPVHRIGGLNHFMLPERGSSQNPSIDSPARYGAYAMELLINELLKHGASRAHLEAKVFGAGRVLSSMTDIGRRNAEFALEYLAREKIAVRAQDLGGVYPRKIAFEAQTGRVLVKLLRNRFNEAIAVERAYGRRLEELRVGGEVDLFQ